ncbi:MAG TPA: hypothetical protein VMF62_18540 [Acetobacteraceae bacterium]|jgi:hypothetical protein|nr:hypothetical protein [Acetobacteraceae bacterium]
MRTMLRITFPTELGNRMIRDGSFTKVLETTMEKLKPEAAYFTANKGCRSAMLFFDMKDSSDIPAIAEPLFMGLNAEIEMLPVMNQDDLQKGLTAAMQAM